MKNNTEVMCQICNQKKLFNDVMPAELIREQIVKSIKKEYPNWSSKGFICINDLNHFRSKYVQDVLESEKGELSTLESEVVKSLKKHELLSRNLNKDYKNQLKFGERIADRVAEFGGSWKFIIIFLSLMFFWIGLNTILLIKKSFDPYPFILLNLILSCIAALQAPVIMMSQNRQEAKDRLRAEHDYRINLKAELEIRHLHDKIDHLLRHQWQKLLEIQQI